MIVVDASITVGWLLLEEAAASTLEIYELVLRTGAVGPAIYPIEVANALRNSLRRKGIDRLKRNAALAAFERMADSSYGRQPALVDIVEISDRHDLTVYDASYVALAKLLDIPLATLDDAMARAARAEGLTVLP